MNGTPTPGTPDRAPSPDGSAAEAPTRHAHRGLVQAPVRPLDEDGVTATIVGTTLFALASLVMLWLRMRLDQRGDGWWLWVCVAGTALGLVGQVYCRRRASRLR